MRFSVIIALAIALVAVLFALQNATPVAVTFLGWKFEGSLALVLVLTLFLGVLIGIILSLPAGLRKNRTITELMQKIGDLERKSADAGQAQPPPTTQGLK